MRAANFVGDSPAAAADVAGTSIAGRYRLGPRLGSGGEGDTFSAADEMTGRACALKIFRNSDRAVLARVRSEFERLIHVEHPGVVRALDLGRDKDRLFLVTDLVAGDSIRVIADMADDGQRLKSFARVAREVADALAYLHARGIVHGDVSPENIRIADNGHAVLIDLGASGLASTGGAVGTLGFAAPEALVGEVSTATDLFALGASLFYAWTGVGPFGIGVSSVDRMLAGPAPAPSTVRAGLTPAWERLIAALLQSAPEQRPTSARTVLRLMAVAMSGDGGPAAEILAPFPSGDPLAGVVVGREPERRELKQILDRLGEGACPNATVAVVGADGSGRRTLIDAVLRDVAIGQAGTSAPPLSLFRGSLAALVTWLAVAEAAPVVPRDEDAVRDREIRFARIAKALDGKSAGDPVCVALTAGADELAFARFVAGAAASGRWLVLIAAAAPLARVGARDVIVPAFSPEDVVRLAARALGEPAPPQALARVTAATAGHAATAALLVRQLVEAVRRGDGDRFAPAADARVDELLRTALRVLPEAARVAIAGVALGIDDGGPNDDPLGASDARGRQEGRDAGRAAGWITGGILQPRLPSALHEAVLRRALADVDLREVAHRALARLPPADGRHGYCLEALGDDAGAVAAFQAAAARARADNHDDATTVAAAWLEEAARIDPTRLSVDEQLSLATARALGGRPEAALQALDAALSTSTSATVGAPGKPADVVERDRLRVLERRAWLLGRSGDLAAAQRLIEAALVDAPVPPATPSDALAALTVRLARVLVSQGRFEDAIAIGTPWLEDPAVGAVALESVLLAHAYLGRQPAARMMLDTLKDRHGDSARACYLAALLDHLSGDLPAALELYRRALTRAESSDDIHTVAAIALNMGALAAEAGRYDEALTAQDRAIRELGRLGATELGTALFNAGILLVELGDLQTARALLARLRDEAKRPRSSADRGGAGDHLVFQLAFLDGELALQGGDPHGALVRFTEASRAAGAHSAPRIAAELARAELLGRQQPTEAAAILTHLEGTLSGTRAAADVRLTRARLAIGEPTLDVDAGRQLAIALESDAAEAARAGRRPHAWRAALAASRLFHRAGDAARAEVAVASARQQFEELRMATPADHRPGLDADRDARFLTELSRMEISGDDARASARAARATRSEDRLRRLLRINKRLNSELRLPRLLELIMDTVIELTEAERGFVLLEDDAGELVVKVARNIDQQSLESGAFELSRSIARQAATGGVPIVTIDAAGDPRFRESLSVSDLHLRSVLAVPLTAKTRAVGTLYVDNRLRKGAFDEDDVQLVLAFAEQAGIAIENARLLSELRRRERQIEVLNRRLQSELAVRKEELVGMKQELRENRVALAIRYDYRNIVGRTPRMLDLFRLLDRLTDTALPVVIQGESGTGKELVARALHFNGPRRDKAFVSENCAAIPETLLEATLFGAVRGAYTGADHDTRGLFEVADGGTLFLDEVGEMSPGMQGKLLRILQSGELRRVGSERMRKVDVRIIAATNRDLGRMVEEGKFRQDLFFRLSVAPIVLPPLRERREDIPAIVEHVLKNKALAAGSAVGTGAGSGAAAGRAPEPRRVDAAAMARLAAYRWPGNIRELENELMRAAALCSGPITVADLSAHVAGDAEAALTTLEDPDDLSLRPRVERLERALLREAMSRLGGNQTRAAAALGLSRFGLQKKLRRYKIA